MMFSYQDGRAQVQMYEFTRNKWLFTCRWFGESSRGLEIDEGQFQQT
jgi:hypothetical protein